MADYINNVINRLVKVSANIKVFIIEEVKKRWREQLAIGLGIVAIILALQHESILRKTVETLEGITTKSRKDFPNNFDDIYTIIDSAKDSLTLIVDQPAYGGFSNPKAFEEYYEKLRKKITPQNFKFKLIYPCAYIREKATQRQFEVHDTSITLDDLFVKSGARPNYRQNLDELFTYVASHLNEDGAITKKYSIENIRTFGDFNHFFSDVDNQMVKALKNINLENPITAIHSDINFDIWLADDNKMLFSLITYGQTTEEHCYQSEDKAFIDIAQVSFKNFHDPKDTVYYSCTANDCPGLKRKDGLSH
jgi:hypothetical protein